MASTTAYEIASENGIEGVFRVITSRERISGVEKFLESFAANAPSVVTDAFLIDGQPVKIMKKPTHLVLSVPIKKLAINTTWSVSGNTFVPEYTEHKDFIAKRLEWTVPEGMALTVAIRALKTTADLKFRIDKFYLFATLVNGQLTAGTWKLPLPNQFDGGHMCLGEALDRIRSRTLMEAMEAAVGLLHSSTWNADQLPDMLKAKRLFRFDLQTLAWTGELAFANLLTRVSAPTIEEALLS